jgi:hypothetical protein
VSDEAEAEVHTEAPVPYARFAESRAQLKAAKDEIRQRDSLLGEFKGKAESADAARTELAEARAALASLQAEAAARVESMQRDHLDTVALLRAGIQDDEGIAVARTLYGMQPEDGRPAMPDWLAAFKAEGAVVPRPLQPYLAPPVVEAPKAPKAPAPNGRTPSATGNATDAAIKAERERFKKTGDSTSLKALLGMT